MEKSLSIQEAWDTLEDDQRQFERTVAKLRDNLEHLSKNQESDPRAVRERALSQNGRIKEAD